MVMLRRDRRPKKGRQYAYISRSRALKKLQLTLRDFRRLCILKGIYPREPPKRPKRFSGNRAYYHVKDIAWMKHEPLLKKFRELKTWSKKWKKWNYKKREDKIKWLKRDRPQLTYSHLVRERFPDFEDAIRNLNDPLSMLNLFGLAPAKRKTSAAKPNQIRKYALLSREFLYYVAHERALRKAFVSIKGIYYEAVIRGVPVVWLVPHKFTQFMPRDVDYAVMASFLHFYHTMVRFINYKLYLLANLDYPPTFADSHISSLKVKKPKVKKVELTTEPKKIENLEKIVEKADADKVKTDADKVKPEEEKKIDTGALEVKKKYLDPRCTLFEGLVFLLNRETPQESLEFLVTAMGGKAIWQQATRETGIPKTITHQVIDRNPPKGDPPVWELIQPQWVFDCLNVGARIPVMPYAPGKMCPPHLSPFHTEDSAYEPKQAAVLREWAKMGRDELEELEQAADVDSEAEREIVREKQKEELAEKGHDIILEVGNEDEEKSEEEKEGGEKRKLEDDVPLDKDGKPMSICKQMKLGLWKQPPQPPKIRRRDLHKIPNLEERKKLLPRKYRYLFGMIERGNKQYQEVGEALEEKRELLEKEDADKEAAEKEAAENEAKGEKQPLEQDEKDSPEKMSMETDATEKTTTTEGKESSETTDLEMASSEKSSLVKDLSEETSLEKEIEMTEKALEAVEEPSEKKGSEELEKKTPPEKEMPQESETK